MQVVPGLITSETKTCGIGTYGKVYPIVGPSRDMLALKVAQGSIQTAVLQDEYVAIRRCYPNQNVVEVIELLEGPGSNQQTMVMPYYDCSLRDVIEKSGIVVREDELRFLARELFTGLAGIHSRGVIHCDIKPDNILFDRCGQVRITDFGIAKLLPRQSQLTTCDPKAIVTFNYRPPDLFCGATTCG